MARTDLKRVAGRAGPLQRRFQVGFEVAHAELDEREHEIDVRLPVHRVVMGVCMWYRGHPKIHRQA